MAFLTAFVEFFRFVKHYRERQEAQRLVEATERELERQHQRMMLEIITDKLVSFAQANQEGLLKLAEAANAQANVFQTWIDGFKPPTNTPEPPSRVSDEDEWEREEKATFNELAQLHPDFALALKLNQLDESKDPNPGFDREGRDIF